MDTIGWLLRVGYRPGMTHGGSRVRLRDREYKRVPRKSQVSATVRRRPLCPVTVFGAIRGLLAVSSDPGALRIAPIHAVSANDTGEG
jgi:hypothetical protein